jgi:hypothetical protein
MRGMKSFFALIIGGVLILPAFFIPLSMEGHLRLLQGEEIDLARTLERDVTSIIDERGVSYAISLTAVAVKKELITNDECHGLLHLIGHEAYLRMGNEFGTIIAANQERLCLGGYLHGVEAEIASSSNTPKEDLWLLCAAMQEAQVTNGPCFHGVGHSIFELTRDLSSSLAFCDSLSGGPEAYMSGCYQGAFSELGFALLGIDSDTKTSVTPYVHPGIKMDTPLQFCITLPLHYRESCQSQLSKIHYGNAVLPMLRGCEREGEGAAVCVHTVVGMWTRQTRKERDMLELAKGLEALPPPLQEAALKGMKEGDVSRRQSGQSAVDMSSVCPSFGIHLQEECQKIGDL